MNRVTRAALVVLCASARPALTFGGDASITFGSDESWTAYAALPDGTMGAPLGDALCVCLANGGCPCCWTGNTGAIPGACWVWKPGTTSATSPVNLEIMYLSKTITIPGFPDAGQAYFAADDFAELRVNGTIARTIGSVTDYGSAAGAQAQLTQVDVTPYLLPGANQILVRVQNGPGGFTGHPCDPCSWGENPTGVILGGTISYYAAVPNIRRSWGALKLTYR